MVSLLTDVSLQQNNESRHCHVGHPVLPNVVLLRQSPSSTARLFGALPLGSSSSPVGSPCGPRFLLPYGNLFLAPNFQFPVRQPVWNPSSVPSSACRKTINLRTRTPPQWNIMQTRYCGGVEGARPRSGRRTAVAETGDAPRVMGLAEWQGVGWIY